MEKFKSTPLMVILLLLIASTIYAQDIFNAILADDIEQIKLILKSDPSQLELIKDYDHTPLMSAASNGKNKIVEYLIKRGANINYLTPRNASSLSFAAMFGHFEVVKILVENGAKVNIGEGYTTPIFQAIEHGTKEVADYLVDHGAKIPVSNSFLHNAVSKGIGSVLDTMLNNGAEMNSLNDFGGTLLHSTAKGNLVHFADQAKKMGLGVNARNRYGISPLHIASRSDNLAIVKWLIENGADIELKTPSGKTAYTFAQEKGFSEIVEILNSAGAKQIMPQNMNVPDAAYLGLNQPGLAAELFAPGILTTEIGEHGAVAISPKMDEIYWQADGIKFIKKINGKWTFPDTLKLFQYYKANNPAFSSDGNKLFFHSPMSLEKDGNNKDMDIWSVQRTKAGWSEPENLGPNVNTDTNENTPSVARNENIYFGSNGHIFMSENKEGQYQPRKKLDLGRGAAPCIAPDESFIIFESIRLGGHAFANFYISFSDNEGNWTPPVIMGEDVCRGMARFPGLSPDGKYLFFISGRAGDLDIYWVSTKIIEELKQNKLN